MVRADDTHVIKDGITQCRNIVFFKKGVANMPSRNARKGFSLVELIIVIVIIGIIAAIAVPRMSRGARGANESALVGNLAVLRNAVELYATEHNNVFPGATDNTAVTFVDQLTKYTSEAGATSAVRDAAHPYGPYLRKGVPAAPVGPNKGSTTVLIDNANSPPSVSTGGGEGWVYNPSTGDIIVNCDLSNDAGDKNFNEY